MRSAAPTAKSALYLESERGKEHECAPNRHLRRSHSIQPATKSLPAIAQIQYRMALVLVMFGLVSTWLPAVFLISGVSLCATGHFEDTHRSLLVMRWLALWTFRDWRSKEGKLLRKRRFDKVLGWGLGVVCTSTKDLRKDGGSGTSWVSVGTALAASGSLEEAFFSIGARPLTNDSTDQGHLPPAHDGQKSSSSKMVNNSCPSTLVVWNSESIQLISFRLIQETSTAALLEPRTLTSLKFGV
ncbi:hypothetical protein HYALB_00000422 [Hymenoscyphus albidus]|uniref:Uncharacterized protein n=1 Tax=Hymenoscyphus albidus TaxID=595503 RepID=A0A9N9LGL7_9HELO|nr:hypothetical protein HYALB_00000422 [Hymenoscyphus albidus]